MTGISSSMLTLTRFMHGDDSQAIMALALPQTDREALKDSFALQVGQFFCKRTHVSHVCAQVCPPCLELDRPHQPHPHNECDDTHLWICVLTDSGATRRPRVPFPKNTSKNHWGLGVFKRKWGPSLKSEGGDQGDMTTYAHICRCISTLPKD